ncbi:MAG TPA: sugar porter family MFS transporter [Flavitalea sp.]|nr:sugar porter family MFS transporter [Flavitalea sp.]
MNIWISKYNRFSKNIFMQTPSSYNFGYIVLISLISALGGYLFGFDFAVISGALPFLKAQFGLDAYWEGFTTGSLALGCIAGCFLAGSVSQMYGRKPALLLAGFIFIVSSLAMAFASNLSFFITARFAAGISVGMASMLSPMYIAEVSPPAIRGRMVSIYQLTIVIGILMTNLVNYSLRNNGDDAWRWMFGLGAIPAGIFTLGVLFLPESPRWLVQAGRMQKAKRALSALGDARYAEETYNTISGSLHNETIIKTGRLFRKPYLAALIAGIGLAVFQQFCGINVVFNYTTTIFQSIGFSTDDQLLQTIFIGAVNLMFTFLAMSLVDKVGRKPLLLSGSIGLSILYIAIAGALNMQSSFTTYLLLAAIGLYASTLAPVTWIVISEIFPNKIRAAATSIAVICLWAAYFVLTFTFPILVLWMGGIAQTFYVYAAICIIGAVFIWFKTKETTGKTLEQMDTMFAH